jgi:hypothetical protein
MAGLAAVALLALNGCGAGSAADAEQSATKGRQSTTPSTSSSAPTSAITWKLARDRLAAARSFTFEGRAEFVNESVRVTGHQSGEVDRAADSSRLTQAIDSPDPRYAIPGRAVFTNIGKRSWMQMTEWPAPNRGKWLDMTGQVTPAPGQHTVFEEALLAFTPTTDVATRHEFTGSVPLAATAALLGLANLRDYGQLEGDVDMTVTVDSAARVTHVRLDGSGLTGSSLSGDAEGAVRASTFEADVNLAPRPVTVKAPPKKLVVTSLAKP